jgi:hypothetical protein
LARARKGVQLICPKCGRPAYYGKPVKRKGKYGQVYTYTKYLHYAGRRGSITVRKLEGILSKHVSPTKAQEILVEVRGNTGAKRVEHYVPVERGEEKS